MVASDGFTYERKAITDWIARSAGHPTSPKTNLPLAHPEVTPNVNLRNAIQKWLQEHAGFLVNGQG